MILVLHQGAIGDFLLTLSVLQPLRGSLHDAPLTVIASAASARLCAGRSAVDHWISPESVRMHCLFSEKEPLDDRIKDLLRQATVIVNFLSDDRALVHQRLVAESSGRVVSIDPRPTPTTIASRSHIARQWTDQIRQAGLVLADPEPARLKLESTTAPCPVTRRRVIIHPGSGGRAKCWPFERFMALTDLFREWTLHWMLGPAECEPGDTRFTSLMARQGFRKAEWICEPDLHEAAKHIAAVDLYIGNDSGMSHLAAALGVPAVILFGPTDPQIWKPLSAQVKVVATTNPGQPLSDLSPDRVREAIRCLAIASH